MITNTKGQIKLVGPGGRTRWIGHRMWQNRLTRQSILDSGFVLANEEDQPEVLRLAPLETGAQAKRKEESSVLDSLAPEASKTTPGSKTPETSSKAKENKKK